MNTVTEARLLELVRAAVGPQTHILRVQALAGDASTRRYVRIDLDGPAAPPTLVAMLLADRAVAMSSDELASLPDDLRQLPYLNVHEFLAGLGMPVPEVCLDASSEGVLLLEDIGDTALWDVVSNSDPAVVRTWYGRAVDLLVSFQRATTAAIDARCIAYHQAFDRRLARWELDHFIEWGVERRFGIELSAPEAHILGRQFDAMAEEIDAAPRAINHRDFHSWNLYVQGEALRIIDFQDALMAPIPYDLATLLGDRDTPLVVTPEIEAEMLERFRTRWAEAGGERLDPATFERTYFLCSLQKALKVVGRFHFLDKAKGKPGYLRFLPATIRQIRRVAARLDGFDELLRVIDPYLSEGPEPKHGAP